MSELIELVFEVQTEAVVIALLDDALAEASCLKTTRIGERELETPLAPAEFVRLMGNFGSLRFSSLKLPNGSVLQDPIIRVLRGGSRFEIEMNWKLTADYDIVALQLGLHEFANQLARRHGISAYYAGLEPASDTNTRIFTGEDSGPCELCDFTFAPF